MTSFLYYESVSLCYDPKKERKKYKKTVPPLRLFPRESQCQSPPPWHPRKPPKPPPSGPPFRSRHHIDLWRLVGLPSPVIFWGREGEGRGGEAGEGERSGRLLGEGAARLMRWKVVWGLLGDLSFSTLPFPEIGTSTVHLFL